MFFAEENNLNVIDAFLKKAAFVEGPDGNRAKRLSIASRIIKHIHDIPKEWDERCTFNIKHIGVKFITLLSGYKPSNPEDIDYIYVMAYRFLCEFDFLVGASKELSIDLISIKDAVMNDAEEIDGNMRSQIFYASYFMPAHITKEIINDSNIGPFRNFEANKIEAEKLKIDWDKEIEQKKSETEKLKNKLDEYETAFNFVGLYKGFSDLADKKNTESRNLFWSLIIMGCVILIPLLAKLFFTTNTLFNNGKSAPEYLVSLIPLLSIEVVLIYFFRIILLNYRSVEAQKIQIELRKTLCQFIQSYAEYATKIKTKDSGSLEKFENLIFSGILSNPEKLPSTFDGLDQISELFKKIKKS